MKEKLVKMMDNQEKPDLEVEKIEKFVHARAMAIDANESAFVCPVCGGTAFWNRSTYNGHLHSWCEKCHTATFE